MEIRLWWTLPLAAIVWLLIIWGFGFFLKPPTEVKIETPPPIEARFVELPESIPEQEPPSPLPVTPPTRPQAKPKVVEPVKPVKPAEPIKPVKPPVAKERARAEVPSDLPSAPASEAAPTDMMAYVNQARERRRAAGIFDEPQAVVQERQPSEDEIRMARINRNLQAPGLSGVFQIIRMGPRTAQFSFRGWSTNSSQPRLELIEVDAGPNGDVERTVIRRMIQLIRQYHKDNFNWESHRLNRVIVLSARLEDNTWLEEFLMEEFFGEYGGIYRR
ncbi:MAG: hypothetical protein Q8K59_10370 [Nitrosomonas sp.]|nr:hypothetical protein [Nitrosomonas sp.]